jgi:signal transduction histidine kinase
MEKYSPMSQELLKEIFMSYHIGEEFLIASICVVIMLRSFKTSRSKNLTLDREQRSRIFLVGSGFILLGLSSAIHASIHTFRLNQNLLYQTLLGYCLGLLVLIIALSSEKPWNKKAIPLLYIPLVILLFPDINKRFPIFGEFRPLVWLMVAYLSGIVCMLYIANFYRRRSILFLHSALGHALICSSAILLFFPAAIGSKIWLYGHIFRPVGFGILFFSMNRKELTQLSGSILYRTLMAFSLLAAIPLIVYGTVVFYENVTPIEFVGRRLMVFLLLLTTLVAALLFGLVIIRLIRPILYLKDSVDKLVDEGFNRNIEVKSNDEIGELSHAFNEMVGKLKTSMSERDRLSRLAATGELSATLAHEIKNPLNAIGGAASYLGENYKGSLIREFLKIISDEVTRINMLTNALLSFAKPIKPEPVPADIKKLVNETIYLLSQEAKEQNVRIDKEISDDIPIVSVDYDQIKQILLTLIINSFEAVDEKGNVLVKVYRSDGNIMISVEDNGRGIREDDIINIFNPFFTTKTRGTGLGLSISKKIAREHGGDIFVESALEKGSRFTIALPFEK